MLSAIPAWLKPVDHFVLISLVPLALILLFSGFDDLLIDLAWIWVWLRLRPSASTPGPRRLDRTPTKPIAILVPLWHEHEVIATMLEHNLAALRYPDYHIFAGAYPNDTLTQQAIQSVARRCPNVHLALCPHDGPTSKADCLNWIYQHVGLYEEQTGMRFEIVVTHDAEDIIHPEELRWINYYAARHDFVQIPVLALRTPLRQLTHGIYCDEFAEFHTRDMVMRARLGGFVPGSGVGTGYRRDALESLAATESNRIFSPDALTEDYENGLSLFRLGRSQTFVPVTRANGEDTEFVATREYFPQTWSTALRQRTRWVMGVTMQGWERHGWGRTPGEAYWFWRDRKGLIGSPISVIANLVFVYGAATSVWLRASPRALHLMLATLPFAFLRVGVRMACVARVYGIVFSMGVPLRILYSNLLNAAAASLAVCRFASAKLSGRPLRWLKTDHAYPSRAALLAHKRPLGEILVSAGELSSDALVEALGSIPPDLRLGEYLIRAGLIDDRRLYEALSLQQGLPFTHLEPDQVPTRIARALPEPISRQFQVLPFRVEEGSLFLAGPELPTPEMNHALRAFTSLEIRFHLVTPATYEKLAGTLL